MQISIQITTAPSLESVIRFRGWLVGLPQVSQVTVSLEESDEMITLNLSPLKDLETFKEQVFEEAQRHNLEISVFQTEA